jgi:glycosyltransferase involved in cell wall biosynthesis
MFFANKGKHRAQLVWREWEMAKMDNLKDTVMVSVICNTYNHELYIKDALEGIVKQQTDFAIEVLVHDDASTDHTADIVREYEAKYPDIIKPMYEEENQYQQGKPFGSAVWNFPRAKGKYIALCEGDDYWIDPFKLQKQVDFLEKNPEYGLIYTDFDLTEGKRTRYVEKFPDGVYFPHILTDTRASLQIQTLTVLFRASDYSLLPKYFIGKGWLMGDTPLWIEFSKFTKIKYLPIVTARYRVLENSASHSLDINKLIRFRDCGREICNFYAKKFSLEILDDGYTSNYYEVILRYAYRLKDKKVGTSYFKKALKQKKITFKGFVFYIGTIFTCLRPIIGEH